jgi:acyl-CoA reductase-like NAD-dependent aldehyde dehydrogenase
MGVTARRLLASKLLNAGQVCLAPDYVLVEDAADAEARKLTHMTTRPCPRGDTWAHRSAST